MRNTIREAVTTMSDKCQWRCDYCDRLLDDPKRCCDAPSASVADTAGVKPIYQCMANDDDDNPTSRNLWMDVDEKAFDQISIRSDVRARVVYATPPAPSVAEQKLVDESNGAWAAFEKSPHADMSNRGDLWPVWKDAWNAASAPSVADAAISTKNIDVECARVVDEDFWNLTYAPSVAEKQYGMRKPLINWNDDDRPQSGNKLCSICHGYGRYQDGNSGTEADGYAPNIVECECTDEERRPECRQTAPSVADAPAGLTERERFIWNLGYSSGKENA